MDLLDTLPNAGPFGFAVLGAALLGGLLWLITAALTGASRFRPNLGRAARGAGLATTLASLLPLAIGWLGTRSGLRAMEEALAAASPEVQSTLWAMGTSTAQLTTSMGSCSSSLLFLTTLILMCLVKTSTQPTPATDQPPTT